MRKAWILVVLMALLSSSATAQLPRPTRPIVSGYQLNNYLTIGGFPRTVTVAPASADFTSLAAAYSYISSKPRSASAEWLVLLYPNADESVPGPKPTYTSVVKLTTLASPPGISSPATTTVGAMVLWDSTTGQALGGSSLYATSGDGTRPGSRPPSP